MNTAIHRTTYKYYSGMPANTLDTSVWLLNPDISSLSNVPQKYWKVDGDSVVEMTATEKNLKDQLIAATNASQDSIDKIIALKPDQDHFSRIYIFSCDFTKKESWYINSEWFTDSFAADGIKKTFQLSHGSGNGEVVVDLSHGKITDEASIISPSGSNYLPIVKINGAVQTEREAYEESGGHFEVDYVAGTLTFFAAPPDGNTVTFEGWYSPDGVGPRIEGGPGPGKKWIIDSAEIQFSRDIQINDTFVQNVFADIPIFDASGNYVQTILDMKVRPDTEYLNTGNVLDYTYGSFPTVPAHGGPARGLTQDTIILRWDYPASLELKSSLNMKFKAWTKHNRGFGGERAVVTIYGVETDE